MFKVVVFALDFSAFNKKKQELETLLAGAGTVLWCNSSCQTRGSIINEHTGSWLFFMDYDCIMGQKTLDCIKRLIAVETAPRNLVYSGLYENPHSPSYFQKVHNFIANTWLEQSYSTMGNNKLILGGVFLIYSTKKIKNFENILFWGAEDKALSYELNSLKYKMSYVKELSVQHNTSSSYKHFLKRAYLHGVNDVIYIQTGSNKDRINYQFWIRKIGFANLDLSPLVLLHFCIQKTAMLIQKVLR